MKRGDLSPVVGSLKFALRDLQARWETTHEMWNDSVAQRFKEQHVEPLEPTVQTAVKAIERLARVLMQAYDACSAERE